MEASKRFVKWRMTFHITRLYSSAALDFSLVLFPAFHNPIKEIPENISIIDRISFHLLCAFANLG